MADNDDDDDDDDDDEVDSEHVDGVTAAKSSRRQSIIDGVRRFRHALLPSKDSSRSLSQASPALSRRTLEVEHDSAASRPQDKRPSTSSDR